MISRIALISTLAVASSASSSGGMVHCSASAMRGTAQTREASQAPLSRSVS